MKARSLLILALLALAPISLAAQSVEKAVPLSWSWDVARTGIEITSSTGTFAIKRLSGAVEDLNWNPVYRRLSGTVTRPKGEAGSLYLLMPRKMRVINDQGLLMMKELEDMNVVIRKEIKFTTEHESFELFFFEPWEEKFVVAKGLLPYTTEAEWLEYVRKRRAPGDTRVIE